MTMRNLKIKINVIWDKQNVDGEIFAEAFYRYFCSGELSALPENIFSIPVRCKQISDYHKRIICIQGYLTVNVLLADTYMRLNDRKRVFVEKLENVKNVNHLYIPIALDKNGLEYIDKSECVTAYKNEFSVRNSNERDKILSELESKLYGENKVDILWVLRRTLERIAGKYCYLVNKTQTEKVNLFICHTKSTGEEELDETQARLAVNTGADSFVDRNTIMLGERFDKTIFKEIKNRAVMVIATDDISGREWCLKEIMRAKEYDAPILIVDAYKNIDNRLFPYVGNCPLVRFDINDKSRENANFIYEALANEILWNTYNIHKQKYSSNVKVLARKIELTDLIFLKNKYSKIVYPEPPLGATEKSIIDECISRMKKDVTYETEISARTSKYKKFIPKVMISSSSNPDYMRVDGEGCCVGINYAVREIVRYLIYMGCTILNAGNYEDDGFNRVILTELTKYASINKQSNAKCVHFVRPDINEKDIRKTLNFEGNFVNDLIEFKRVEEDAESTKTGMHIVRDVITSEADMLIVIGGMYDGDKKTGIDEEVELAIQKGKSVYLLGGFGFKAKKLCDALVNDKNLSKLNSGLKIDEYKKLANMYDIGEILELIFKGWSRVCRIKSGAKTPSGLE